MTVELEALQEARLGTKGTVIDFGESSILNVSRFEAEVVEIIDTVCIAIVGDNLAVVDGSYRRATDFAIEHTVHHHCLEVAGCGSDIVIANYTACMSATGYIGIAETVDDTGTAIEQSHDTAHIATAANAAATGN